MEDLEQFRQLFCVVFRNPRNREPLTHTERYRHFWPDMEPIRDWLAGPLYSIDQHGECDYVFTDQENRFPGVATPDDFLKWCLALADRYRTGILAFAPLNDAERADQEILIQIAAGMATLSHLAHRILTTG